MFSCFQYILICISVTVQVYKCYVCLNQADASFLSFGLPVLTFLIHPYWFALLSSIISFGFMFLLSSFISLFVLLSSAGLGEPCASVCRAHTTPPPKRGGIPFSL
jgi:hypothetical protein